MLPSMYHLKTSLAGDRLRWTQDWVAPEDFELVVFQGLSVDPPKTPECRAGRQVCSFLEGTLQDDLLPELYVTPDPTAPRG